LGKAQHEASETADESSVDVILTIDQARIMDYLNALCALGPRISGTDGMRKQQEMLQQHFERLGGAVSRQIFLARQKQQPPIEMTNLIVSWHADKPRRVLLCSHYDTRPIADKERVRANWTLPFVSANDGGSGVALLMELAHHIEHFSGNVGIDFVFFDGEEYIFNPLRDKYFFGSEHFAQQYLEANAAYSYLGGILFDMIAGHKAHFPVEPNSWFLAPELVQEIWSTAAECDCDLFQPYLGVQLVDDDHLALNYAGIPTIDIIDIEYEHWHKLSDVLNNCAAGPMAQVARVVGAWIGRQR
jgi:hypothetical protein